MMREGENTEKQLKLLAPHEHNLLCHGDTLTLFTMDQAHRCPWVSNLTLSQTDLDYRSTDLDMWLDQCDQSNHVNMTAAMAALLSSGYNKEQFPST